MSGIVPKNKTKGVDICSGVPIMEDRFPNYIIRSDLGCYMYSDDFHEGKNLNIYSLHPYCKDGDHYLASKDRFYIIKGDSYRTVSDLTKDSHSQEYDLHPNCRGGDHYLCVHEIFFIIFQSRGVIRQTTDLKTYKGGFEYELPSDIQDALYYWGTDWDIYALKPTGQMWLSCIEEGYIHNKLSVHPDVVNFLPGGLAVTQGPAFAKWELIKTTENYSDTPITCKIKIIQKVGYNKSKSSSIEHNWKVSASIGSQMGLLTKSLITYQFSLSAQYGGLCVNTESENWEEATQIENEMNFTLQPNNKMNVWQYKLGFGKEGILFSHGLRFTNDPNPPADTPLPAIRC